MTTKLYEDRSRTEPRNLVFHKYRHTYQTQGNVNVIALQWSKSIVWITFTSTLYMTSTPEYRRKYTSHTNAGTYDKQTRYQ